MTERRGGGRGRDRDGGGRGRPPRSDEETTLAAGPEDERPLEVVGEDAPQEAPVEAAAPEVAQAPEAAETETPADAEVGA